MTDRVNGTCRPQALRVRSSSNSPISSMSLAEIPPVSRVSDAWFGAYRYWAFYEIWPKTLWLVFRYSIVNPFE